MSTLRKRLACLNYRLADEITVTVTQKTIRAYTPRVKAALKAIDLAMKAKDLLNPHYESVLWGSRRDSARLSQPLARAVQAEADALEWRMDYLLDVVRADLGPRVARELVKEFAWGGFVVR